MDFHVRVDHGEEGVAGVQQTVSTQDSLVARFSVPIAANPVDSTSTNLESLHKDIRNRGPHIRIGFELRCSENFYGEDCSRNCVSRDDIGGHFVCDMQGNKRCMSGYQNLLTNCTECALSPECCKLPIRTKHAMLYKSNASKYTSILTDFEGKMKHN